MPKLTRRKFKNESETYQFLFDQRDLDFVRQFTTKTFPRELKSVNIEVYRHTWKQGDKLYKLAAQRYGDFRMWWIIALTNKISCESDLSYGDVIIIPSSTRQITDLL